MSIKFSPFQNDADVITVGDRSIENHAGSIELIGNWSIERTKPGLIAARALLDVMQRAVEVMVADAAVGKLPDSLDAPPAPNTTANPFRDT